MRVRYAVPVDALAPEGRALVALDGREIAVFCVRGQIHAFENECPHARNPLIEGEIVGDTLVCAYHRWRFDLETGACLVGELPAKRYPVEVRDGVVWIELEASSETS